MNTHSVPKRGEIVHLRAAEAPTTFAGFAALGYTRLVPVIPPQAEISENSSLYKRVGTSQDSRGKAVGIRGRDGKWFGFDWLQYEADEDDYRRWQEMGAGIGIKTGQQPDGTSLILIDADTLNEDSAKVIRDTIEHRIGLLPVRIGNCPKVGYLIRVDGSIPYTRVEFGDVDDKGRLRDRVELLSDGRQFVAHGIHPKTGNPYHWPRGVTALSAVPEVSPDDLTALLGALQFLLPNGRKPVTEGAKSSIDQAALRGDIDLVRKAVSLIPNTSEHFATRESYRDFGYAIKAALPDEEPAAFEVFSEWCERWQDGENDPEIVEADWRRMRPPFRRGANWLYELAEQHAPGQFSRVEAFFKPLPDEPENPFEAQHKAAKTEEARVEIAWTRPRDWHGDDVPARKWLVDGVIPDGEVTLLTGDGGTGKTLLAQQMGTCVAQGLPFFGRNAVQGKVVLFLCEDAPDELHRRQRDINRALCLDMLEIDSNMRFASRKYSDNLLALFDRSTGALKRNALFNSLVSYCKEFGAKFVIVDTIADTFGGSEIDRSQVRQFVQGVLGRIAQEIGGAVLALGHPSRAGKASGDGTSGSTAWHASVRSRLYLEHASKDGAGPFRRLTNKKANYGPAGDVWLLKWSAGTFEAITEKTAASDPAIAGKRLSPVGDLASACLADVLEAVRQLNALASERAKEAAAQGMTPQRAAGTTAQLSAQRTSSSYAPKVLAARFPDLLGMYRTEDVEAAFRRALDSGALAEAVVGRRANRNAVNGYRVTDKAAAVLEAVGIQANTDGGLNDNSDGVFG